MPRDVIFKCQYFTGVSMAAEVDADLGHRADGERVDAGLLGACALDLEGVTGQRPEEALGHLAPGRVVRAEVQHPRAFHWDRFRLLTTTSIGIGVRLISTEI